MKKLLAISAALLLAAGGTVWAAVSLPSAPAQIQQQDQDRTQEAVTSTPSNTTPDTMGRRRRGHGGGGGGGEHICGTRFCGQHYHHHGHVWCDGHSHWYCPGHD